MASVKAPANVINAETSVVLHPDASGVFGSWNFNPFESWGEQDGPESEIVYCDRGPWSQGIALAAKAIWSVRANETCVDGESSGVCAD